MGSLIGIGEFARSSGLSISALRFYADRGLLVPADIDADTGYRAYHPDQSDEAALIRDLRRLDFGLAAMANVLAQSPAGRHRLIDEHVARLGERLRDAEALARSVHRRIDQREGSMTAATVGGHDLAGALNQVLFAVGRDLSRPVLTCLLIEARDGSLRLVATDSYRLAIRDLPLRTVDRHFRALIPGPMAHRLAEQLEGADEATFDLEDGALRISGLRVGESIIEVVRAEFPRYETLLAPESDARWLVVEKSRLANALECVGDREDGVLLTLESGHLLVEAESSARLDANYEGPALQVAVNARFSREAVAAMVGPEVVLEVVSPVRRVVFRSADDGSYTHMLMPIRRS